MNRAERRAAKRAATKAAEELTAEIEAVTADYVAYLREREARLSRA